MTTGLSDVAKRIDWVLKKVWHGSQTKMARDIGVSQSVISHVIVGRQEPGRKLLAAIASNPVINSTWLITGEGDPLVSQITEPGRRALYIARSLFEGLPEENSECLGSMQEVPLRYYRRSRYWIEVESGNPLTSISMLNVKVGDFVLFEPDAKNWPANLVGHPCIVRTEHGDLQFDCVVNQHDNTIRTSCPQSTQHKEPQVGKHYRVFTLPEQDDAHAIKPLKVNDSLIAIGIYRVGGFGKSTS